MKDMDLKEGNSLSLSLSLSNISCCKKVDLRIEELRRTEIDKKETCLVDVRLERRGKRRCRHSRERSLSELKTCTCVSACARARTVCVCTEEQTI